MTEIPSRIPAEKTDWLVSAMRCFGDMMVQMELEFDRHLDVDRLARAVELACDAEPILGCRLVTVSEPCWQRLSPEERRPFVTVSSEQDYDDFKNLSIDTATGPLARACLHRTANGDRVLVKVAHDIADAGGVKDVVQVISTIYNRLEANPGFTPEPNLTGDRSAEQVLRQIPLRARPVIFLNWLREAWGSMVPLAGHTVPVTSRTDGTKTYLTRTIESGRAARIAEYGRRSGATVNDVMMTAVLRAHASMGSRNGKSPLRLWTTIDNRRYLPTRKTGGICNLSAVEIVRMPANLGSTFADSLSTMAALSRRRKSSWFGLNAYISMYPLMRTLSYEGTLKRIGGAFQFFLGHGLIQAALTNMGKIQPEQVSFGFPPVEARLLVPPVFPPFLGLGLSGYAGSLALSAGVFPSSSQKEVVCQLLERTLSELPA
jgi:NRPS condensation-like uncharacterized protein